MSDNDEPLDATFAPSIAMIIMMALVVYSLFWGTEHYFTISVTGMLISAALIAVARTRQDMVDNGLEK